MSEDTKKPKNVSRRDFLKSTGGAAAIAGLALGGVAAHAKDGAAASHSIPEKWDETYDVVIIGSGFAGLAAAIEARNAGAKVTVLEKMAGPWGQLDHQRW